jgi:hypothetical protein
VVDPPGIPEPVCPPIEHDPQTAVTRKDASQPGVSGVCVSRDHDEPLRDALTPAWCPLARRRYRGSGHSCRLTRSREISSDTAAGSCRRRSRPPVDETGPSILRSMIAPPTVGPVGRDQPPVAASPERPAIHAPRTPFRRLPVCAWLPSTGHDAICRLAPQGGRSKRLSSGPSCGYQR